MADNVTINTLTGSPVASTEEVTTLNGGAVPAQHIQRFLLAFRTADSTAVDVPGDAANGVDVDVTRVQGTVAVTGPVTDAELRATPLPVSGTVSVSEPVSIDDNGGSITVDGPLTDAQLRATAVPVSGTVTTGGLTDAQLRATAVPVSGTVSVSEPVSVDDNGGSLTVDGTVAVSNFPASQPVTDNGSSLTVDAPLGTPVGVRLSDGTSGLGTTAGRLHVDDGGASLTVDGTVTVQDGGTALLHQGDVANDGVDAGNPVKIGGQARIGSFPTAVAQGDRVNATFDKYGRMLVRSNQREIRGSQKTTITSSTAETTIVTAGGAAVFNDLHGLILTNTSASACNVTIKDATGGTTRLIFAVPAGETRGFMLPSADGHKQATANNNWTATCSASVASLEITALYVLDSS